MDFITDFFSLSFKRKLFVIGAIGAWYLSIKFSKIGFGIDYPDFAWIGWALAMLVTICELAFNDKDVKPTLTIVILGLVAYSYGIWTNVSGIWYAQNPNDTFGWGVKGFWMATVVGSIMEIVPEMLIMLAYGRAREADPLGILAELVSGKLMSGNNKGNQNRGNDKRDQRYDTAQAKATYSFGNGPADTQPKINTEGLFGVKNYKHSQSRDHRNPRWNSDRKN